MRRKVGLFVGCAMLLPLVVAASAYGQGATLRVNDSTPAAAGQQIVVTGNNFGSVTNNGAVTFRIDSRTAEPLDTTAPDTGGNISATLALPALSPGWHLLFATQTTTANGRQTAFTPGRVRLNVGAPDVGSAVPGGGGRPGSPLGLLALGAALVVLATGVTLTVRRLRTHNRPQLVSEPR